MYSSSMPAGDGTGSGVALASGDAVTSGVALAAGEGEGVALSSGVGTGPGGQDEPHSARNRAAARVIAVSLPNATSRGRYFIQQSGASTRRSAGT